MRTVRSRLLALLPLVVLGSSSNATAAPPEQPASGPVVRVIASYPGANAQTVNEVIANPMHLQINGVEGLTRLESESRNDGTCEITLRFNAKTDANIAQILVQNRVNLAMPVLPELCMRRGIVIRKGDFGRFPPVWVAVTSPAGTHDAPFLSNVAELLVKDDLHRLPGVAEVRPIGASEYRLRVWLDPDKLQARSLTAQDVITALEKQKTQVGGGVIGTPNGQPVQLTIDKGGQKGVVDDLNSTPVKTTAAGAMVMLKDVGRVEFGTQSANFVTLNGKPAAILALSQLSDKSVTETVRKAIPEIEKMPKDVNVEVVADLTATPFAVVELRLPETASRQRTQETTARAEKLIRELPGITACLAFGEAEPNVATMLVNLTAKNAATPADIRKALRDIPQTAVRVSEVVGGQAFPLRFALSGPDSTKVKTWAEAVAKRVGNDGLGLDVGMEPGRDVPQLQLSLDRAKLAAMGVSASDVAAAVQIAVGGAEVNDFDGLGRTVSIRIDTGAEQFKVDDLKRLRVRSAKGDMVPLGVFADVKEAFGPPAVLQVDLWPAQRITAAVPAGKTLPDAVTRCLEAAEAERKKLDLSNRYKVVDLTTAK